MTFQTVKDRNLPTDPFETTPEAHLPHLVVSILNYRTAAMTLDCLASVLADFATLPPDIRAEVVIVDNASDDGSAQVISAWIAAQAPPVPVRLVESRLNTGFSGGHNQAMAAASAAFWLVLNSDALLRPGFCTSILAAAEEWPDMGLFAPRIDYEEGEQQVSCFRFASPWSELIRGAASGPVTQVLHRHVVALQMPPEPASIEWASFACILLRGKMLAEIGPMDEGYFLYFEDSEYCLRARRAGWGITYVDTARAVHFRGGSGPVKGMAEAKKRVPGYFYAARTRFLFQAHGWVGLWAANLLWIFGRILASGRWLLGKPVPAANAGEWRDIWINAISPLGAHPGDPRSSKRG